MTSRSRPSGNSRLTLGEWGEDLACAELRRRGYAILERRYRTRHGEIDIIARHESTIVFVEVKARAGVEFGGGAAAVTAAKQQRIARMATDFMARRRLLEARCRFDVVAVDLLGGTPRVEVYSDAFTA